jgi:hypothetical protein
MVRAVIFWTVISKAVFNNSILSFAAKKVALEQMFLRTFQFYSVRNQTVNAPYLF